MGWILYISAFILGILIAVLIAGLDSPWRVLWWKAKQNRLMVLKYYGIPFLILLILLFLLPSL